jgi:hypothetical protein
VPLCVILTCTSAVPGECDPPLQSLPLWLLEKGAQHDSEMVMGSIWENGWNAFGREGGFLGLMGSELDVIQSYLKEVLNLPLRLPRT